MPTPISVQLAGSGTTKRRVPVPLKNADWKTAPLLALPYVPGVVWVTPLSTIPPIISDVPLKFRVAVAPVTMLMLELLEM